MQICETFFPIDRLLEVPPEAFSPAPKVHSALVRLIPRPLEELNVEDEVRFSALVSAAFKQRRKMLRNGLRGLLDEERLAALGVAPTARAEELSVDTYVRLSNSLE